MFSLFCKLKNNVGGHGKKGPVAQKLKFETF